MVENNKKNLAIQSLQDTLKDTENNLGQIRTNLAELKQDNEIGVFKLAKCTDKLELVLSNIGQVQILQLARVNAKNTNFGESLILANKIKNQTKYKVKLLMKLSNIQSCLDYENKHELLHTYDRIG